MNQEELIEEKDHEIVLKGQVGGIREEGKPGVSMGIDQGYLWDLAHHDWSFWSNSLRNESLTNVEKMHQASYVQQNMAAFCIPPDMMLKLLELPYRKFGGENGELHVAIDFGTAEKKMKFEQAWEASYNMSKGLDNLNLGGYREGSYEREITEIVHSLKNARGAAIRLLSVYHHLCGVSPDDPDDTRTPAEHILELLETFESKEGREWIQSTLSSLYSSLNIETGVKE